VGVCKRYDSMGVMGRSEEHRDFNIEFFESAKKSCSGRLLCEAGGKRFEAHGKRGEQGKQEIQAGGKAVASHRTR
jgi:hypothetical protein